MTASCVHYIFAQCPNLFGISHFNWTEKKKKKKKIELKHYSRVLSYDIKAIPYPAAQAAVFREKAPIN